MSKGGGSPSHPVYSDYTHISNLASITFAVGLREEDTQGMLDRIMPLQKIIPKIKIEKKKVVKKTKGKEVLELICSRPECGSRKTYLNELTNENLPFKKQLKNLESKLASSKNRLTLTEKTILNSEEKIEIMKGQIEDLQARIQHTESDAERTRVTKEQQKETYLKLEELVRGLREQTEEFQANVKRMLNNDSGQKVIFSSNNYYNNDLYADDATAVASIRSPSGSFNGDSDSD